MKLADLRDVWKGDTVYVVGSSAAWRWLDPRFFDDKRTIGINLVPAVFGLSESAISVSQYGYIPDQLRERGWQGLAIAPCNGRVFDMKQPPKYAADERTIRTSSVDQNTLNIERWPSEHDDWLLVGSTSLQSALYLAWYMGASSIVTVAADHGWWGDQTNDARYENNPEKTSETDWFIENRWVPDTDKVAARLRTLGCNVYSMIPTVNLNLEGLSFSCPRGSIGSSSAVS